MDQILIIIGASIFGVLGTIHLVYTFYTNKFHARDPSVTEAMKGSSPVLTKETTMWKAWVGFNASHSFGAMLFAGIYVPLAMFHFEVLQQSVWLSVFPLIIGISYAILAKKYWFRIPLAGILIATACFALAAVLLNA